MNFIIVDDSKAFMESVRYLLVERLGHTVIGTANDGREFTKLENIHEADIVLMDIEMPELNGPEAVKLTFWKNRHVKFIAVTSYRERAYLMELVSAGFKACIYKDNFYQDFDSTLAKVQDNLIVFPDEMKIDLDENTHETE